MQEERKEWEKREMPNASKHLTAALFANNKGLFYLRVFGESYFWNIFFTAWPAVKAFQIYHLTFFYRAVSTWNS